MPEMKSELSERTAELDAIRASEEIAARQSVEPLWFMGLTAATIFVVFNGIKPEGPNGLGALIVLSLVRLWMVRNQGLVPLSTSSSAWRWASGVMALTVFYLGIVYLFRLQGVELAPLAGGIIAAVAYAVVAGAGRKRVLSSTAPTRTV